jgi:transcriptional regulator with XRE-family HTH domain
VSYTEAFREQMVRRMLSSPELSAAKLANQVGVTQPTLSRWLRESRSVPVVSDKDKKATAAKQWTTAEKLRVVGAAGKLSGEALGAFLRREGLHEAQLTAWRDAAAGALQRSAEAAPSSGATAGEKRRLSAAQKRVRELEKELRRKDRALAEAAALLLLEKKLQDLGWDDRDKSDEAREPSKRTDK